jgi:hypothetical protein
MGGVGRSVSLSVVDRSRRYETTCVSYLDSRRAARRAPLATRPSDTAARRDRGKVRGAWGARSRVFARVRAATSEPAARLSVTAPSELDKSNAHARRGRVVGRIREKAGVATGGAPHPANRAVPIAMHGRVIRTFDVEGAPSRRVHAYLGHGYPRHRARGLALERGGTSLHNPSTFLLCSGVSKRWSDVPGSRPNRPLALRARPRRRAASADLDPRLARSELPRRLRPLSRRAVRRARRVRLWRRRTNRSVDHLKGREDASERKGSGHVMVRNSSKALKIC